MAFAQQYPRPFTRAGIGELNLDHYGVYGISVGDAWIYVGKGNICERLLAHLNGDNDCILQHGPTHYVCEVTATANADSRERELIVELMPICGPVT